MSTSSLHLKSIITPEPSDLQLLLVGWWWCATISHCLPCVSEYSQVILNFFRSVGLTQGLSVLL